MNIRNASNAERRLSIDVKVILEAYNQGIVEDDICFVINYNLANAMTKTSILPKFVEAMETG